jgi:hypothetical protein
MKLLADKHMMERTFDVGVWVYLKLQSYVQMSVVIHANHKMSYEYFGPYLILQKLGSVTYKFQLLSTCHIHPVVHVCQLKKAIPPATQVSLDADLSCLLSSAQVKLLKIVAQKMCKIDNRFTPMVQV